MFSQAMFLIVVFPEFLIIYAKLHAKREKI